MSRSKDVEERSLNAALASPDPLLQASLSAEEQCRRRRLRSFQVKGAFAGLAALLMVGFLVLTLQSAGGADATLTEEGWALWQRGQAVEAEKKFREALEGSPKSLGALNGLGWALLHQQKFTEAQVSFRQCLELAPEHGAALNGLGQAALSLRDYKTAEEALTKAAPTANAAWYGLARVLLLTGRYDEAIPWIKKIISLEPNAPLYPELLAAAESKTLSAQLREQIEPPDPQLTRAWQLMNSGEVVEAKELLVQLRSERENDSAVLNALGFCLLNLGDHAAALPEFEKCLKLNPDAGGALNGLARCHKAAGKTDEALALWKKLDESYSFPTAGTVGLAMTYMELGKHAEAIPYFERLLKAQPGNAEYARQLEECRKAVKP